MLRTYGNGRMLMELSEEYLISCMMLCWHYSGPNVIQLLSNSIKTHKFVQQLPGQAWTNSQTQGRHHNALFSHKNSLHFFLLLIYIYIYTHIYIYNILTIFPQGQEWTCILFFTTQNISSVDICDYHTCQQCWFQG
jgi:hypothetical protein